MTPTAQPPVAVALGWTRRHGNHLVLLTLICCAVLSVAVSVAARSGVEMPSLIQLDGAAQVLVHLAVFVAWWVPAWWRRTRPERFAAVIAVTDVVQLLTFPLPLLFTPSTAVTTGMALYHVARYGPLNRRRWVWPALAVAGAGLLSWLSLPSTTVASVGGQLFLFGLNVVLWNALAAVFWAWGLIARHRHDQLVALADRATAAERERDHRIRLAVHEARAGIARDMHDVVAHALAVIVVQADGAAFAARSRLAPGSPKNTANPTVAALDTIASTARDALAETRRLVGVLRSEDAATEYQPSPGYAGIERLLSAVRDAGRVVTLHEHGTRRDLTPDADLAAYRVAQEATTNALKHAAPHAVLTVTATWHEDRLHMCIDDDADAATGVLVGSSAPVVPPSDKPGHGLIGMRERVRHCGGTCAAGPREDGRGYRVDVSLPYRPGGADE